MISVLYYLLRINGVYRQGVNRTTAIVSSVQQVPVCDAKPAPEYIDDVMLYAAPASDRAENSASQARGWLGPADISRATTDCMLVVIVAARTCW